VRGAYFLSRFFIGIGLFYPKTFRPVDLLGVFRKIKGDIYEMQVIMGGNKETQVCCRPVCLRVNQEVANARRRRLKKTSRERGRTPSQFHLLLADWTLMVTNVPEKWLPPEMARPFYSLGRLSFCLNRLKRFCAFISPIQARKTGCAVKYMAN